MADVEKQSASDVSWSSWSFRKDIQGFRGVAVLFVLLFHARIPGADGGFVGVDAFFVISGFVVTGMLLKEFEDTQHINLGRFYVRRFRRLLPASFSCAFATVAIGYWVLNPVGWTRLMEDFKYVAMFCVNVLYARTSDYFRDLEDPSPLLHYWSLNTEEQFYFVWPIFLYCLLSLPLGPKLSLFFRTVVLLSVTIVSFVSSQIGNDRPWAFFLLPPRAWQMLCGAFVALHQPTLKSLSSSLLSISGVIGLVALCYCFGTYHSNMGYPGSFASVLPTLGAFLVICSSCDQTSFSARFLSISALRWVGYLSYSLYLYHWPGVVYAATLFSSTPSSSTRNNYQTDTLRCSLGVLASVPVAWLSERFIEKPIRTSNRKVSFAGVSFVVVMVSLSCVYFAMLARSDIDTLLMPYTQPATEPVSNVETLTPISSYLRAAMNITSVPPDLNHPLNYLFKVEWVDFVVGDVTSNRSIIVTGDSHSVQWQEALDEVGKQFGYRVYIIWYAGCPSFDFGLPGRGFDPNCEQKQKQIIAQTPGLKASFFFMTHYYSLWEYQEEPVRRVYDEFITFIKEAGSLPIIMQDIPTCKTDPLSCLPNHLNDPLQCGCVFEDISPLWTAGEREIAQRHNIPFLEVTDWFCIDGFCPPIVENIRVLNDDNHLSPPYARFLAPYLAKRLKEDLKLDL